MYNQALLIEAFHQACQSLIKKAFIKHLNNGKWQVQSQKGKNLGTYDTKEEAAKRLRQVEYFKHHNNADDIQEKIDLTTADNFSYSAIMRCLNKQSSKEQVQVFLGIFKKEFDKALKQKMRNPAKLALKKSLIKFNKQHPITINQKLLKQAQTAGTDLGNPVLVGKYLSDIVKFTLTRIPLERRSKAIESLRQKFYAMNVNDISQKNLPPTSAIGQSITFVKHVLFNHDPFYVREVLNNLVKNL